MTTNYNMRLQEAALAKMYQWGELEARTITLRDAVTKRSYNKVIFHSKKCEK